MTPQRAVIAGVGMTRFTKMPDRSGAAVGAEAVVAAIRDAGIRRERIQAGFCGSVYQGPGAGQRIFQQLGMTGMPIVNVESQCASGGSALREAIAWVESGTIDAAVVVGVEMLTQTLGSGMLPIRRGSIAELYGLPLPGQYAMRAQRHMDVHGLTHQQLAAVSVKNRANAADNTLAHFQHAVDISQVLDSRAVAGPLTLLQCCANVDGAAATVVTCHQLAEELGSRFVEIAGAGATSGGDLQAVGSERDSVERCAAAAYEDAGLGPSDIDVCEVHDPFTIGEILHYEELGFCEPGGGGEYIERGGPLLGGTGVPVNTSGGLLGRGHPLGASGLAQIHELTLQLRGTAGRRQVEGARVGLAQISGGDIPEIDGNACLIHILRAPSPKRTA